MAPPWDFDEQVKANPFFAQVWNADHNPEEDNFYTEDSIHDIVNSDLEWRNEQNPNLEVGGYQDP